MAHRSEGPPAGAEPSSSPPLEGEALEERRIAGSPGAQAASAAVLALTRAARSFTIYDSGNKVVRGLIADYREKMAGALAAHGDLALDVHPFELTRGGEVVYVERDRERSLAFRLFRDGVRRLGFAPTVTWEELLRLLEIFSIRYTGVRQQEDDLVTLLRKAGFAGIRTEAIEGFVPDEELAESTLGTDPLRAATKRFDPSPQWDRPLPSFPEPAALQYRPVSPEVLARLRSEEGPATVPRRALQAVEELLRLPGTAAREAALGFALEVRDFLVVEGEAGGLVELARAARAALGPETGEARAFLGRLLDQRALQAVVAGQPEGSEDVPPALAEVLDMAVGDPLSVLLDLLAAEGSGPRAGLLRSLVTRAALGSPDQLLARIHEADGAVAGALLGALHDIDPRRAIRAAHDLAPRAEAPLQLEILRRLEAVPFDPEVGRTLRELLDSPAEEVRVGALELLARRGGARVAPLLQSHVEKRASVASSLEAEAAGRALAQASPQAALLAFHGWLHPKGGGLLGRIVGASAPPALQRAALAGMDRLEGPDVEALLAHLAEHGEEALRRPAAAALAARRRPGGPRRG
jgi:hypothetical protein